MKSLFVLLFVATLANAKTVLISDIDDTIKVSNVLDKSSAIANSNKTDNIFYGMPQLYHSIQKTTGASIYYLSNAPKALMTYYHRELLSRNQFPSGGLLLRGNVLSKTHKIKSIRSIIQKEKPTTLILIGDNGEHDPEVYAQAVIENPNLRVLTYIRQAYSAYLGKDRGTELQVNQMGFVSPVEVALSLNEESLISQNQIDSIENHYVPFALEQAFDLMSGTAAFPGWQDCRDFKVPESLHNRKTVLGKQLVTFITKRCSTPGIDPDSLR